MLIFYENTAAVAMKLLFRLFYVCVIFMHERKKAESGYSIHDETNGKNNIFFSVYVKKKEKTYHRGKTEKKLRFLQVFVKLRFVIKIPI
jgi:hypothetical protein